MVALLVLGPGCFGSILLTLARAARPSGPFLCGVGRSLVKAARESAPVRWQPRGGKIGEGYWPAAKPAGELVSWSTSRPKFQVAAWPLARHESNPRVQGRFSPRLRFRQPAGRRKRRETDSPIQDRFSLTVIDQSPGPSALRRLRRHRWTRPSRFGLRGIPAQSRRPA